jgi:ankyrin repeat protein
MWAAGQGHTEVVKLLLGRAARTDLRDDRGMTALDIARATDHREVVDALTAARPSK